MAERRQNRLHAANYCKMQGKSMDFAASWPRPGGTRGPAYTALAVHSASARLISSPSSTRARQGAGRIEPAERYTASPRSGIPEGMPAIVNGRRVRFIARQNGSKRQDGSRIGFMWQIEGQNGGRIGFMQQTAAKCKENQWILLLKGGRRRLA